VAQEETLPRHQLLESRRLAACVLAYVAGHHDAVAPLFELLAALEAPTAVDFSFVLEAYEGFAETFSAAEKAKVRGAAPPDSLQHCRCALMQRWHPSIYW
jgi:hypothetical protein